MMKFNKKAGELSLNDLYNIASCAVCSKTSCCDFQLKNTKWRLSVGQLVLTLDNRTTGERYEQIFSDQPEETECLQLLVHVLQYE